MFLCDMAIILNISQPNDFLVMLKDEIDKGVITRWSYDEDGDFTLTNRDLAKKAWFHPYINNDEGLLLGIIGRKNAMLTLSEYSLYHSAMLETIILFNKVVSKIVVTQPMVSDFDTHSIENGNYEY